MRDFNPAYVRFGSGTDITRSPSNVRFTPQSGQTADISICLLCAKSGLMHRNMRARSAVLLAPSLRMMLARWNSTVTRKTAIGMLVSFLHATETLTLGSFFELDLLKEEIGY